MKKIFSFFVAALFGMTLFADNTTIYCKQAQGWWNTDGAAVGAYLWKGEGGDKVENAAFPGVRMTPVAGEENLWKVEFEAGKYEKIIFSRVSGDGELKQWNVQSEDLTLPTDDKDMFTVTSADAQWLDQSKKIAGDWSKYVPTPAPKGFYVTGDSALVVDAGLDKAKAWNADAIKCEKDTQELSLKAGVDYLLKITLDGTFNTAKSYNDLTDKTNLKGVDDGMGGQNIGFQLKDAGKIQVIYFIKDGKAVFEIKGNLVEVEQPKLEDGYYLIGQKGWEIEKIEAAQKFALNGESKDEYKLETTLAEGDKIKVVEVKENAIAKWFPDGEKNEYTVDAAHAGKKEIFFKPAGSEDDAWKAFGGFIYIAGGETPDPQPGDAKFYVTGDSALVVDAGLDKAKAWDPAALKSDKDTLVLKLKKDVDYKLKITLDGKWATAKGYSDLTDKTNLSESEGNICFKLKEDGDVQVIYFVKDEKTTFEIKGNLVEVEKPAIEDGYYLIGQKGWDVAALGADLKFALNEGSADEYKLEVTLKEGEKLKVVEVAAGDIKKWYPDGMGTDYVVDAAHAGEVTIYFKATKNEEWKDFGGFMYIEPKGQGIENTAVEAQSVKFFRNGQLLIMKNGVVYNAQGAVVE